MTDCERIETLASRKESGLPWHSPPSQNSGDGTYLITASCFEHHPVVGHSRERMESFATSLLGALDGHDSCRRIHAWVLLPNHYHVLCDTSDVTAMKGALGLIHGRSSCEWNREENKAGRKVWFRSLETKIKNDRHFGATVNYVHRNPIKHRCVSSLNDWRWSSFSYWMEEVGRDSLVRLWKEFPIDRFGGKWDNDDLSAAGKELLAGPTAKA